MFDEWSLDSGPDTTVTESIGLQSRAMGGDAVAHQQRKVRKVTVRLPEKPSTLGTCQE
jgi:hypothetical protein